MHWPIAGKIHVCPVCKRHILVERGLAGIDHTIEMIVVCFDCLDEPMQQKARERYPLVIPIEEG